MKFNEAVHYIIKNKAIAYSVVYKYKKGSNKAIGAEISILHYSPDHETDPEEYPYQYLFDTTSGLFRSSVGEASDGIWPEEIPDEAKQLDYKISKLPLDDIPSLLWQTTDYALYSLKTGKIN